MSIEQWRNEIDAVDRDLIRLLNTRANLALKIGALKQAAGLPLYDPDRERKVLKEACRINQGPLDNQALIRLFRRIILESRRLERTEMQKGEATQFNGGSDPKIHPAS